VGTIHVKWERIAGRRDDDGRKEKTPPADKGRAGLGNEWRYVAFLILYLYNVIGSRQRKYLCGLKRAQQR